MSNWQWDGMAKASGKAENGGPGNGEVTRLRRTVPDADGLDQARAAMDEAIERLRAFVEDDG